MAISKQAIIVSGATLPELIQSLNFQFQYISDRLDQIEGWRGTSTIESNLDMTGHIVLNAVYQYSDSTDTVLHQMGAL